MRSARSSETGDADSSVQSTPVPQMDRRLTALAAAKELAQDRHGIAGFAMLMADIFVLATGKSR
jgi:hypothetical protein